LGDGPLENDQKVYKLIEQYNILSEKGLEAFKIINDALDKLQPTKKIPIKV